MTSLGAGLPNVAHCYVADCYSYGKEAQLARLVESSATSQSHHICAYCRQGSENLGHVPVECG